MIRQRWHYIGHSHGPRVSITITPWLTVPGLTNKGTLQWSFYIPVWRWMYSSGWYFVWFGRLYSKEFDL